MVTARRMGFVQGRRILRSQGRLTWLLGHSAPRTVYDRANFATDPTCLVLHVPHGSGDPPTSANVNRRLGFEQAARGIVRPPAAADKPHLSRSPGPTGVVVIALSFQGVQHNMKQTVDDDVVDTSTTRITMAVLRQASFAVCGPRRRGAVRLCLAGKGTKDIRPSRRPSLAAF